MWCNGSHGISVGSLGQYAGETDIVANVFVKNITMLNAQNGARIKVFGGSPDASTSLRSLLAVSCFMGAQIVLRAAELDT